MTIKNNKKKTKNRNHDYRILLLSRETKEQLGTIKFDISGMLILQSIKDGLHVFTLKSVMNFLSKNGLDEPLYCHYEEYLKKYTGLSDKILLMEVCKHSNTINNNLVSIRGSVCQAVPIYKTRKNDWRAIKLN